eukprot:7707324-Ditylum_brightwellii.AAC.1
MGAAGLYRVRIFSEDVWSMVLVIWPYVLYKWPSISPQERFVYPMWSSFMAAKYMSSTAVMSWFFRAVSVFLQVWKALRLAACCCRSNSICAVVMNGVGGTGTGPGFLGGMDGAPPERARYQVGFMTRVRCLWLPPPNVVATEAAFSMRRL